MGFSSLAFAVVVQAGYDPFLGIAAALVVGAGLGFSVGALVVYGGLSSLVATLGMNFMLRGVILILTNSKSIAMPELSDSLAFQVTSSQLWGIPGPDLLGRCVRGVLPCSTTAIALAHRSMSSATIQTAPMKWASTSTSLV